MPASSAPRDPRSIVTPEAFDISQDLLGLQLASPRRRLAALLLDLVFIGIVTVVTRSFALVLGVIVAGALIRAGFLRTPTRRSVFDRARRASIGCLGVFVGLITAVVWAGVMFDGDITISEDDRSELVFERGSGTFDVQRQEPSTEPVESRDAQAVRDGVSLYTVEQALDAYAALLRADNNDAMDREVLQALEARLASAVASDTLRALEDQIEDLEDEASDALQGLQRAQEELDEGSGGLFGWLVGLVDDLGFGFGWAALYMTVWMSMTNGQTLGKRMLGIRVLRLDGLPINWWVAFERAGGYAAGFATGLLGFAQIYWDANRQAIHDRIVGTVVVREGLDRVVDWESAL
jgi:hypothetical protein